MNLLSQTEALAQHLSQLVGEEDDEDVDKLEDESRKVSLYSYWRHSSFHDNQLDCIISILV